MKIDIIDKQKKIKISKRQKILIRKLLKKVAKKLSIINREISLSFIDNKTILELNRYYRGENKETDILSFSFDESNDKMISNYTNIPLGDILISLEKVWEQAESFGNTFEKELSYLIIHGILHLCGYDHNNIDEKYKMRLKEEELLSEFNFEIKI